MNAIERFFAVASHDRIARESAVIIADLEETRNDIRKKSLSEIDKLNPKEEGEKVAEILLRMNREISMAYEKEAVLREFIDRLK